LKDNHIQGDDKMNHYIHLTINEREDARVFLAQGFSLRAAALKLKRSASTLSRELKRNAYKSGDYTANHAQKLYQRRRHNCGKAPMLTNKDAREHVLERLEWGWSAEQIAGRAKLENESFSISYATIYRAVDSGVLPKQTKKLMRFKWKYKKHKFTEKRGTIQNTTSIHDRPASIETRLEVGHWESDTVLGKRKTGCFGTHVERKTGYLIAFYLPDRKDHIFNIATAKSFSKVPSLLKKSFTVDNGKEFTHHQELAESTGMNVYFCDPYSPWQRGTNENTNGLLRQFFPKGTSFSGISDIRLASVVQLINNRPRKRFEFKTPNEMLSLDLLGCCT